MRAMNPAEFEAVQRIAGRAEGQMYRAYLEECLAKVNEAMATTSDECMLRQFQGHAQVLRHLVKAWKP